MYGLKGCGSASPCDCRDLSGSVEAGVDRDNKFSLVRIRSCCMW